MFEPDLEVPNAIYVLENIGRAKGNEELAGISLVVQRPPNGCKTWPELTSIAVAFLIRKQFECANLGQMQWVFFGATNGWRPSNAVVRRKGFWGNEPNLSELSESQIQRSEEVELASHRGIRFAIAAYLERRQLGAACNWIRSTQSGFLFLSKSPPALTSDFIQSAYCESFKPDFTSVDWSMLAGFICGRGDILVRCSGAFDDEDISIDLIFDASRHKNLLTAFKFESEEPGQR